jgi:hypothetical protein
MKDLAPNIYRQRLLIEGLYDIDVQIDTVHEFFTALLKGLGANAAGEAIVNSSLGQGKLENQGIEAFIPLIESGVAFESPRVYRRQFYLSQATLLDSVC